MIRDTKVDAKKLPMGVAEYDAFIKEFKAYNDLVTKAVEEFAKKEVTINIEPISEDSFGKLMDSNDWTFGQTTALSEIICEQAEAEEEEKPKDKKKK